MLGKQVRIQHIPNTQIQKCTESNLKLHSKLLLEFGSVEGCSNRQRTSFDPHRMVGDLLCRGAREHGRLPDTPTPSIAGSGFLEAP